MGILQNIREAFVSKEVEGFNAGLNEAGQPLGEKLPVHPEWFFTAKLGQPRNINIQEIRRFAKSPWVQMVLNTIKKEISIIPWDIINKDEDDEEKYDEQTKLLNEVIRVLEPFAQMDREEGNLKEVDCQRGYASDLTIIDSQNFREANKLLEKIKVLK